MKLWIILVIPFISQAQNTEVSNLNACKDNLYYQYLYPKFGKAFVKEHFSVDEEKSYFNYFDCATKESYSRVGLKDSDTINGVPHEYNMKVKINHKRFSIGSFNLRCYRIDNNLRSERLDDLDSFLRPYMKVIERKALNLDRILDIAKQEGYHNVTEWEIDYEKNKKNEYKWFFPRVIWTLKERVSKGEGGNKKVIQINAKNGKVIKKIKEFGL